MADMAKGKTMTNHRKAVFRRFISEVNTLLSVFVFMAKWQKFWGLAPY